MSLIHENTRARALMVIGALILISGILNIVNNWETYAYSTLTLKEFMFKEGQNAPFDLILSMVGLVFLFSGIIVLHSNKAKKRIIFVLPKDAKILTLYLVVLIALIGIILYLSFFEFAKPFGCIFTISTLFITLWTTYFIVLKKFGKRYDSI